MIRSSRNVVLTLLGSAALFGCCCTSCVDARDEPVKDANGNVVRDAQGNIVYHRHYFYHPWFGSSRYYSPGYSFWHSSPYSSSRSAGFVSGASRSSSGATSRGGFGGAGHATAGS
jgi:hypothetical protein